MTYQCLGSAGVRHHHYIGSPGFGDVDAVVFIRVIDNNRFFVSHWQLNMGDLLLNIFFLDLLGFLQSLRIVLLSRDWPLLTDCDNGWNST